MTTKGKGTDAAQSMAQIAGRSVAPSPAIPVDYNSASYWEAMANSIGTGGKWLYVKGAEIALRLIPAPGGEHPFQPGQGYFKGDAKQKYLFYAYQLTKGGAGEEPEIKAAVAAPSIAKQIMGLLSEGYDLFSPDEGLAIKVKSEGGNGGGTRYTVTPLPKPKPLPASIREQMEELDLLSEKVQEFNQEQFTRNGSGEGEGAKSGDDY